MAKGYLVANIRVKDQERFQEFSGMAMPVIAEFGGKVLARGPGADRHEGGRVDGAVRGLDPPAPGLAVAGQKGEADGHAPAPPGSSRLASP